MFESLIFLVPLIPLLVALWFAIAYVAGFNRGESGEKKTTRLSLLAISLSLIIMLVMDVLALFKGAPGHIILGEWFHSGSLSVYFSFMLDKTGLVMGTLVAGMSLLIAYYSVNYLHREQGYQRFFMILLLFASGLLLTVLAGSITLTFVGWEMAGLSSYLLIGYAIDRDVSTENAKYAFVTNRIGDAGFILALFLAFSVVGSAEWVDIASYNSESKGASLSIVLMAAGLLLAAFAKSAILPFSSWISKALEGPTPSSAIFYGSLMVHAGVYLIIRLEPVLQQHPSLMVILIIAGALTALYGWIVGLVQTDVKSSLIFSTTAQVGLMVLACGLGWFELALWHIVAHAIWRAWQFLSSPSLMHMVTRPARPVMPFLQKQQWLYTAALQRFWLEHVTKWFFLRPIMTLSKELQDFDTKVINRMVGLPTEQTGLQVVQDQQWAANIGRARGMSGRFIEKIGLACQWFEDQLILKGGGEGLMRGVTRIGKHMQNIESLLSQPRYLIVLIVVTFMVVMS